MKKKVLQAILVIIGLVPIITGIWGIIPPGIADKYYDISISANNTGNAILDSNYRFYSGIWFGLGITIFWIIPTIEKHKLIFRFICCMIFIGGIGRVISMLSFKVPPPLFVFFAILELLFPLLIILQNRISESRNT
jgi:hypothetical protein